ncbi:DUF2304 family protein [Candidatus Woesearchaeota archaeon]|nr:DUF2304 family protein [Candidatus Woesearchaeota archaeon]
MDILLIIVVLFVLFAWSRALLRYRDHAISLGEFIFWTFIWGAVIALTTFRTRLSFVADIAGLKRPVDVLIYFSIVLLFYLLFRLYVKMESVEQNMTKVIREIAHQRRK